MEDQSGDERKRSGYTRVLLEEKRVRRSEVRCCMSGSIEKTNYKGFGLDREKEDRIAGINHKEGKSIK